MPSRGGGAGIWLAAFRRAAHERKWIAGDWRNYFTPALTRAFKTRYGCLLVKMGYEKDLAW